MLLIDYNHMLLIDYNHMWYDRVSITCDCSQLMFRQKKNNSDWTKERQLWLDKWKITLIGQMKDNSDWTKER